MFVQMCVRFGELMSARRGAAAVVLPPWSGLFGFQSHLIRYIRASNLLSLNPCRSGETGYPNREAL